MSQYANLKALQSLAAATISVTATTTRHAGPDASDLQTAVTITNTSTKPTVGFFLRADVRRGTAASVEANGDNEVRSSIWSGNDIVLWPGESQTITVTTAATARLSGLAGSRR